MSKTLTEMAVDIATAQSSHAVLSAEEIQDFLRKTFRTLKEMEAFEQGAGANPKLRRKPWRPLPQLWNLTRKNPYSATR